MNSTSEYRRYDLFDMRSLLRAVVAILLLLFASGLPAAEEELRTGNFVVSLLGVDGQRPWIVKALEQNIYNDLSGYSRVVAIQKSADESVQCPHRNVACLLELYKTLNIDALMVGSVDRSEVEFQVYDVTNEYLVKTGSIDIGSSSSLLKLRLGAFHAFKVFMEKGGILDDRDDAVREAETPAVADSRSMETIAVTESGEDPIEVRANMAQADNYALLRKQILQGLAAVICLPFLLSIVGRPLLHPDRSRLFVRRLYPFLIVSLLLTGYQYSLEMIGGGNIVTKFLDLFNGSYFILAGLGGVIWGSFLIANFKLIIPHLTGIERIERDNLMALLRSCLLTMTIKTVFLAAFCAAIFYAVLLLSNFYSFSRDAAILLVFPIIGLFVFYWIALMLDVFAMSNDIKLSGRRMDLDNKWNLKIRNYFIAYLKRNGIMLNKKLVSAIQFLPGEHKGVVCYKGGFGRPRIAIEKKLLIFALGDIDETEPDENNLEVYYKKHEGPELRQSSVFQMLGKQFPQDKKRRLFQARSEKRRASNLKKRQKVFQRSLGANAMNRGAVSRNLALGTVMPVLDGKQDTFPLMTNSENDIRVFEDVLQEFAKRHAQYADEAKVDDAHEYDMDFLFGALLHNVGSILRRDTIFSTTKLYFARRKKIQETSYKTIFSKPFAVIADTFVVLNFGLNHLIQHLYFKATNDPSILTTKGVPGRMLANQDAILSKAKELIDGKKRSFFKTDEMDRITWLSRFSSEPLERDPSAAQRISQMYRVSFALVLVSLALLLSIDAYNYHPRYLEIIEMEKQEIAEAIEQAQVREGMKTNE